MDSVSIYFSSKKKMTVERKSDPAKSEDIIKLTEHDRKEETVDEVKIVRQGTSPLPKNR